MASGQVATGIEQALFGTLLARRSGVDLPWRWLMADTPRSRGSSLDLFELTRCCAEAQADGVPCPTIGRACEICERAVTLVGRDPAPPPIRPVGAD
jgi:hypothetical protein